MSDLNVEVTLKQGRLRGVVDENVLGGNYLSFRGIPYATPPVGELRFQDPLPPKPWTGIRDGSSHGDICTQFDMITNLIRGSDDCLYLNVYTKTLTAKQPVMVWIHGGGFVHGSGDNQLYGPDFLVAKDVVIVTINYRLGVLGFLNLEDEVAPGNQGLKDQVMALKWVQENIANFGGDPKNVTIFGESAGSASVHFLTLSPLAQGLFHKAICQSGVVTNPWASLQQEPRYYGFLIAEKLGKKCTNSREVVEFLRTIDPAEIVKIQHGLLKYMENGRFLPPFAPGVDSKSPNPFMPQAPTTAALAGVQIPLLLGYNSEEGLIFLRGVRDDMWEKINENVETTLAAETKAQLRERGLTGVDLKRIYFGNETICKENRSKYVIMLGDIQFVCGIHEVIGIQVEKRRHPTYFYIYSYDPGNSLTKQMMNIDEPGTCHADEVRYIFCPDVMKALGMEPYVKGTQDAKVTDYFSELWTNFAKTGNPTPKVTELIPCQWKPVDNPKSYNYLAISEKLEMKTLQVLEHRSSWKLKNKL